MAREVNGSFLPIQGCEGYAALFAGVASPSQAKAVAAALSDPRKFLLNFSLPTVSLANPGYIEHGYWKGPTWLDQTWFAYTGLKYYAAAGAGEAASSSSDSGSIDMAALAKEIQRRTLTVGQGFPAGDTTPLNEHYDAQTGQPLGAKQFSWTAAHALMWAYEGRADFQGPV